MSNVNQTAQNAEDAMILNQCNVQLAQVQFNNSKVDDENKLALHFLHEFEKAFEKMNQMQAKQQKEQEEAENIQSILRVVSIIGAAIATIAGQPEIAVAIITTTALSMIPSGQKDKKGNSLSCMDVIVKYVATNLLGKDSPANELLASIIIAGAFTVLTCGAGGIIAEGVTAEAATRLLTMAPLVLLISLGGTGLPQKVTAAIEADKQAMTNFTSFIDWFVNAINTCGGQIELPTQEQLKITLSVLITIAFVVVTVAAACVTIKNMGNNSTILGMIGQRVAASGAAASAAAVGAEEAVEEAANAAATTVRLGAASAWCFDDAIAAASREAADAGTELQDIATSTAGVGNAGRSVAATTNGIQRLLTRISDTMSRFAALCRTHPITVIGALLGVAYVINSSVEIYKEIQLAENYEEQGHNLIEQGQYGQTKTTASFQIKMINTVADNDSKVLQTQWQGDAALQEGFDRFSADTSAIANALLG